MIFTIKAIIHQNTSKIQTTEEIKAKDSDEAILLFKARHAENISEIIGIHSEGTSPPAHVFFEEHKEDMPNPNPEDFVL